LFRRGLRGPPHLVVSITRGGRRRLPVALRALNTRLFRPILALRDRLVAHRLQFQRVGMAPSSFSKALQKEA
jgi:hypothetical protein